MTTALKVDKIISEVKGLGQEERIVLYNELEKMYDNFRWQQDEDITIESAFGLWKDRDIDKDTLRRNAWVKV